MNWSSHIGFKGRWKEGNSGLANWARLPTEVGGISFRKGDSGKEGLSPWQRKEMGLLRRDNWVKKSLNSEEAGEN